MTFDSDGIPFIINNSVTCIISNVRLLFVGNMKPETIHIETVSRDGTGTQYHGRIRLELTDDANIKHTYDMPNAIYDPYTNFNILGIPFLGNFFGDQATRCFGQSRWDLNCIQFLSLSLHLGPWQE
jgi:hypothetical protein